MDQTKNSYAWWIVFAGFILMFSSIGFLVNTPSVFMKPVISSLGFSRTTFSLYFTIATLSAMVSAPFMGKLISKYNPRIVLTICALSVGLGFIGYAKSTTLLQFYLISIPLGIGAVALSLITVNMMITNWFVEKRGLALGISWAGAGVAGMVMNPVINWIILRYGWQMGYIVLGTISLITILPIIFFVIAMHPSDKGLQPYGVTAAPKSAISMEGLPGLTLGETVKTLAFWCLAIALLLFGIIGTGVQNNIIPYLTDLGFSATFAANILSLIMAALIVGKVSLGGIIDRWGARNAILYVAVMLIATLFLLMGAKAISIAIVSAILFGLVNAVNTVPAPYITANLFGRKHYGVIFGVVNIFVTLGAGLGMPISAAIFDAKHSYIPAFILYLVLAVIATVVILFGLKSGEKLTTQVK